MTVPWNGCEKVGKNGCSKSASLTAFFTNYTQVEEETLPEDMYSGGTNTWEGLEGFNPWSSPGAGPPYPQAGHWHWRALSLSITPP